MAANSSIEWTEATWNCLAGCEAVSPGCANCYAKTMTRRLEAMGQKDYAGLTTEKHFNGVVRCLPHKLDIPLKRRKPTTYFVNSMSDLFHEDVPDHFIDKVFGVMAVRPQHTFQVLTKRAERMAKYMNWKGLHWFDAARSEDSDRQYEVACAAGNLVEDGDIALDAVSTGTWPLPNVWLGVSCEDQKRADERIPWLLKTPAAVRFLSCEPLLGPIDFMRTWGDAIREPDGVANTIDWVIVGGESGPGSRPCKLSWIRSIVEQCEDAGAACFVKQLGGSPFSNDDKISFRGADYKALAPERKTAPVFFRFLNDRKGGDLTEWPDDLRVRQMPCPAPGANP